MNAMANTTQYKIDKDVPVPKLRKRRAPRPTKYPWAELRIGESFYVDNANRDSMAAMTTYYGNQLKRHFVLRRERNGVRIWRDE